MHSLSLAIMADGGGSASSLPAEQQPAEDDPGEEENPEPEQPIVETDPSGRYSRFAQLLGRGAFKQVYKAFDEEEGTEVAWNQVRVNDLISSKEERDRLFAEIRVLKQLKHKNIMSFHDSWLDQKTYCVNFITELFTSGTLRQYRKRHKYIDDEVLKRWAWQILCGLVYLHGHNPPIIHRDLKCDNIFINGSQGVVKIGDLGLATLLRARTAPQSVLGTPEFMAPELYDEEYDDRVDVYSFGMCLLELATMEYPYSECRNAAQIYKKVSLGVRPAGLSKVPSKELAEFISVCIGPRETRPRSRQLLKHFYFDSIRERAVARAEAMSATTSQVDMFSDYASVSSSSATSGGSRASSFAGDVEAPAPATPTSPAPAGPAMPLAINTRVGESEDTVGELPNGGAHRSPQPGSVRSASAAMAVRSPSAGGPGMSDSGRQLSGSLQSAVESLHTIAESLPGLLHHDAQTGSPLARHSPDHQHGSHPDREFRVRGKLQPDMDKLNLRLRICEPDGPAKTVEFDFDLGADTAMSVASEMVDDLSLSAEDARAIAEAIRDEIKLLTGLLHRRGDDSLATSSDEPAGEDSSSPVAEGEELADDGAADADHQLQHQFDDDELSDSPFAAAKQQQQPSRIQTPLPFEPGGGGQDPQQRPQPPAPGSLAHAVSGSGHAAPSAVTLPAGTVVFGDGDGGNYAPGDAHAGGSPLHATPHGGSPTYSLQEMAGSHDGDQHMSAAGGFGSAIGGDSGDTSPMSVQGLEDDSAFSGGRHLVHSGSAKTLKGQDSEDFGRELSLVGIKRSGSGVLSPPRVSERKVPLNKLFEDAGHLAPPSPHHLPLPHPDGSATLQPAMSTPAVFAGDIFRDACGPGMLESAAIAGDFGFKSSIAVPSLRVHSASSGISARPPLGGGRACQPTAAAAGSSCLQEPLPGSRSSTFTVHAGDRAHLSTATSLPELAADSLMAAAPQCLPQPQLFGGR